MFISKTRYQALQEIITDQNEIIDIQDQTIKNLQHYITLLEVENKSLKQCLKFTRSSDIDIDFPNSTKGGFEGSDIFTM